MILSDVAKDCIDSAKRNKDLSDRLENERARIANLALPSSGSAADSHPYPSIFRHASTSGTPHKCFYCNAATLATTKTVRTSPLYSATFVTVCEPCLALL